MFRRNYKYRLSEAFGDNNFNLREEVYSNPVPINAGEILDLRRGEYVVLTIDHTPSIGNDPNGRRKRKHSLPILVVKRLRDNEGNDLINELFAERISGN